MARHSEFYFRNHHYGPICSTFRNNMMHRHDNLLVDVALNRLKMLILYEPSAHFEYK